MAVAEPEDMLQIGVYTRQQAAYLSRVRAQTVNRWFEDEAAALELRMPENDDGLVSFVDLIQLMAVREIRLKRRLSLQKIRTAVDKAKSFDVHFPFAREATRVFLLGDDVVLKLPNGDLIQATGKTKKNYLMEPVVLPYLTDLTFDKEGLPYEYRPLPRILLTPAREWGAPVVETCNYTVQTLVAAVQAEGSIEAAADMCGVNPEDVRSALKYEDLLSGVAA
jgi:uncharacterized protein (DUF433 family)